MSAHRTSIERRRGRDACVGDLCGRHTPSPKRRTLTIDLLGHDVLLVFGALPATIAGEAGARPDQVAAPHKSRTVLSALCVRKV